MTADPNATVFGGDSCLKNRRLLGGRSWLRGIRWIEGSPAVAVQSAALCADPAKDRSKDRRAPPVPDSCATDVVMSGSWEPCYPQLSLNNKLVGLSAV
jgi:hypothetical protein